MKQTIRDTKEQEGSSSSSGGGQGGGSNFFVVCCFTEGFSRQGSIRLSNAPHETTQKEFTVVYNEAIEMLKDEGQLESVEEVVEVAEDDRVCDEKLHLGDSTFAVSFARTLSPVPEELVTGSSMDANSTIHKEICSPMVTEVSFQILKRPNQATAVDQRVLNEVEFSVQHSSLLGDKLFPNYATRQGGILLQNFPVHYNVLFQEAHPEVLMLAIILFHIRYSVYYF